MNQQPTAKQQATTLNVLWLAMLAATLVYLLIGWLRAQGMEAQERSVLANMIWLFAVSFIAMGFVLPKILFKDMTNPVQYTQSMIIRWAMFESVAILSLVNFIAQGVSFVEMAIGIAVSFTLILISKPKLGRA